MKEIIYSDHLELRLKFREIPRHLPKNIYKTSNERYLDNETNNIIAVKKVKYKSKTREMALAYRETAQEVILITIHPLKTYQKISRINSGRWTKLL